MKQNKIILNLLLAFCVGWFIITFGVDFKPLFAALFVNVIYLFVCHKETTNKIRAVQAGKLPTKATPMAACIYLAIVWIPRYINEVHSIQRGKLLVLFLLTVILSAFNFGLTSNKDTDLPSQ